MKTTGEFNGKKRFAVLLMGTDTGALNRTEKRGRTDTMILAVVNPAKKRYTLVSIPRDTMAQMVGSSSFTTEKINAAYEIGGGLVTYPITLAVGASKTFVVGSDHVMDRDGYGYTVINPATMNIMALSMSDVDVIYNNTVITSIQVPMQTEAP